MKKILFGLLALVLFSSHVMYLKLDRYFLEPNTPYMIQLFNGTFDKSDNVIDRDRMIDASLMGNGQRIKVEDSKWTEKDSVTILNFNTGDEGTWVVGVSTRPRSIEMDAQAFNDYLEHEGIKDMLEWRKNNNALDSAAVEKYSKHVKAIFQVGGKKSDDWQKPLGYPIEFVPLQNPYDLVTGDTLEVKLLFNGEPLANQLVYADFKAQPDGHSHDNQSKEGHHHDNQTESDHSHENATEHGHDHKGEADHNHEHANENGVAHSHDGKPAHTHDTHDKSEHGDSHDKTVGHSHTHDGTVAEHTHETEETVPHTHTSGQEMRTNADGVVSTVLTADGIWYLQTIHLVNTDEAEFTHESNWTTLTFEVVHGHGEDTHTHEHEEGIPSYFYWIGSLLLIGILFFWFNRKN